jgi:hypothetical protein
MIRAGALLIIKWIPEHLDKQSWQFIKEIYLFLIFHKMVNNEWISYIWSSWFWQSRRYILSDLSYTLNIAKLKEGHEYQCWPRLQVGHLWTKAYSSPPSEGSWWSRIPCLSPLRSEIRWHCDRLIGCGNNLIYLNSSIKIVSWVWAAAIGNFDRSLFSGRGLRWRVESWRVKVVVLK